nr:Retrovirus-related Pol polyprotein from transposon TNT 1-94 [Ipomoea batatas]
MLIASPDMSLVEKLKSQLWNEFEMKDHGAAKKILGMEIHRDCQAVCTRPDLAYAVSVVSRYMHSPGKEHWNAVMWILRYLKGTSSLGLVFDRSSSVSTDIVGFVDFDYGGDLDRRRSLSNYIFTLRNCAISWKAMHQYIAALSTTDAEYIAAIKGVKEATWL